MNEFTRNYKASDARSEAGRNKKTRGWVLPFSLVVAATLSMVFLAVVCKIAYNNKVVALNQESEVMRRHISAKEQEIVNLRLRKQELCSKRYIDSKIAEFGLGLRIARPSQVAYLHYGSSASSGFETELRSASYSASER